jgi:L-histidine N-alpha-methyltransferase
MDMVKRKDVLEAAYNDEQGVTAQFNRNILAVLNRELNADFDLSAFEHLAFYNDGTESIEMHLRASEDMEVEIAALDLRLTMQRGETLFTEVSRKFRRETVEAMAREAGLGITNWYADRKEWFALVEMKKRGGA